MSRLTRPLETPALIFEVSVLFTERRDKHASLCFWFPIYTRKTNGLRPQRPATFSFLFVHLRPPSTLLEAKALGINGLIGYQAKRQLQPCFLSQIAEPRSPPHWGTPLLHSLSYFPGAFWEDRASWRTLPITFLTFDHASCATTFRRRRGRDMRNPTLLMHIDYPSLSLLLQI